MSNVIQFLETMGGNAALARMSAADYRAAIAVLDADAPCREALIARDSRMLVEALNARPFMMCAVVAPDEGVEPPESPGEDTPDTLDEPPAQTN